MIKQFQIFTSLLSHSEKKGLKVVFVINTIGALIDMIGVASIFPFMSVVENKGEIEDIKWLKFIYDSAGFEDQSNFLIFLGIMVIALTLLALSFRVLSSYISMHYIYMTVASMSQRYFNSAITQNYLWFLRHSNSELNTKILGEVENYALRVLLPLIQFIAACILTIVLLALVVIIDAKVAVVIFSSCALFFIFVYFFVSRHLNKMGKLRTTANSQRFSTILEAFEGIKTVKIFNFEKILYDRFKNAAISYASSQKRIILVQQLPKNALEGFTVVLLVIFILSLFLIFGYSSIPISLFSIFALTGYRMIPAIQKIFNNVSILNYSQYAVNQLKALEASFSPNKLTFNVKEVVFSNLDITIKNLSFDHYDKKDVLKDISLVIPHKSSTAIIGPSGCGKTSLLDHLTGLIVPQSGQIMVGNTIIDESNTAHLQKVIGYVPQDIYLMKDTIAKNISLEFEENNIDKDKIWACLEVVNMLDFIRHDLSDQLQTIIGDGNKGFSGGQRQRLGIARALYRSNGIIIMDEATNAIDIHSEHIIMNRVSEFCKDMTMIFITHRLQSIQNVDTVIEMKNGQIVSKINADDFIVKFKDILKF